MTDLTKEPSTVALLERRIPLALELDLLMISVPYNGNNSTKYLGDEIVTDRLTYRGFDFTAINNCDDFNVVRLVPRDKLMALSYEFRRLVKDYLYDNDTHYVVYLGPVNTDGTYVSIRSWPSLEHLQVITEHAPRLIGLRVT